MASLLVTYRCPVCQTEIQGQSQNDCPKCGLHSDGIEVEQFENALQSVYDAIGAWEKLVDCAEGRDGQAERGRVMDRLFYVKQAAERLAMGANRVRERL